MASSIDARPTRIGVPGKGCRVRTAPWPSIAGTSRAVAPTAQPLPGTGWRHSSRASAEGTRHSTNSTVAVPPGAASWHTYARSACEQARLPQLPSSSSAAISASAVTQSSG
jgi:hypothetical protein